MMPAEDVAAELVAAAEGALVVRREALAVLRVTGADRARWLNGLITCDLAVRRPGELAYGVIASKVGKILSDAWVLFGADSLLVAVARSRAAALVAHLEHHLIMEDAEVCLAEELRCALVHGPAAPVVAELGRAAGLEAAVGTLFAARDAALLVGEAAVLEAALSAGAAGLGPAARVGTEAGYAAFCAERGLPRFEVDFGDDVLPQEAGLDKLAVSFSKGCYLGQEAVFMLEKRGQAKRRIARVVLEGSAAAEAGAELLTPTGEVAGKLTSVSPSAPGGRRPALALLRRAHLAEGTALALGERAVLVRGVAGLPDDA